MAYRGVKETKQFEIYEDAKRKAAQLNERDVAKPWSWYAGRRLGEIGWRAFPAERRMPRQ